MKKLLILLFLVVLSAALIAADPRVLYSAIVLENEPANPDNILNYVTNTTTGTTSANYILRVTQGGVTKGTDLGTPVSYCRVYATTAGVARLYCSQAAWTSNWTPGSELVFDVWYTGATPTGDGVEPYPLLQHATRTWVVAAGGATMLTPDIPVPPWQGATAGSWNYTLNVNGPAGYNITGPSVAANGILPYVAYDGDNLGLNLVLGDYTAEPAPVGLGWVQNPITVNSNMFTEVRTDHVYNAAITFELQVPPPTNPSPPDNSSLYIRINQSLDLHWDEVIGATGYKLYWNGAEEYVSVLTNTWTTPILTTGTYTWKVAAYNDDYETLGAPTWQFHVTAIDINPATNPNPADESTMNWTEDVNVQLSWNAPASGDTPAGYKIVFNGGEPIDLGTTLSWQTPLLSRGAYTWQVIPYLYYGIEILQALDCPVWSFTISAPELQLVANAAFNQVWVNHQVSRPFTFTNTGNAVLELSILFNQGFFTINPQPGVYEILPQQNLELMVSFLPTALQNYSRNLYIESNDPNIPFQMITLTGTGYSLISAFSATPVNGYIPLTVNFAASPQPSHQNWFWNFGDGNTTEGINVNHDYIVGGEFIATLTVQDYWGFTLTSSRTIEAISWAEAEVMEEEVSFPITYLGDSSNRIATVHNSGPGILNVSGVFLKNGVTALTLNNAAGLTQILPNQTYELSLSFTPVNEGVVSDSLIIESDARENSRIAINVSGQGNYAPPMPPANVNITVDYPDAVVTWDAVTQSVLNSPVSVPYYFIYGSKAPNATEDEQFYLGYSTSTSFTHLGIGLPGTNLQSPRQYFYYVCAVLYYPSRDSVIDLDSLVGKVSRKELKKLLRL